MTQDERISFLRLEDDPSITRRFIQNRLDLAHKLAGVEPNTLLCFDDSAYQVLEQLTQGNPGRIQYALSQLIPTESQLRGTTPYVITEKTVRRQVTQEGFEEWWDYGRHFTIINHEEY